MQKTRPSDGLIILLLGALATVSPFSIDMYLPSFKQIANDLGTDPAKVSLSITSYFVGLAIGQLFYGPLLDRFGRKKPLYYGLGLYILASTGCMFSQSVEALIIFRFIQALGGCVAFVAAMSMVRDFFPVEKSAKIISMLILVIGLSPLLAPTIGGFVTTWLGWQWVFIVLTLIVLIILAATIIFLPEGHQPDASVSLKLKPMLATFYSILKNPVFSTYSLSGAFSFATLFIYVAGSPFIFMELFHVTPQTYGGIFALLAVGFIGGNQVNILLLRKFSSRQLFQRAMICQFITSLVFLAGVANNWFNLYGTIIMFFISLSCLGLTYPNSSALALAPFNRNIGSASALIGFLQIGVAGLASACVGLFTAGSSVPMFVVMAGTSLVAVLILLWGRKKALRQVPEETLAESI